MVQENTSNGHHAAETMSNGDSKKKVRVYVDGCFDLIHFGHANALRQARAVGDELLVGICSDDDIKRHKGSAPILRDDERTAVVSSLRFVDSVLPKAPYMLTESFTTELFEKHNVDFIVHGDDPCLDVDGNDAYAHVKAIGKFRVIKRTEGISSTNILDRILHPRADEHKSFLLSARRVAQFATAAERKDGQNAVYVAGTFDLFHAGHVKILEAVRAKFGDCFIVAGVVADERCVMSVHERSMMVLACRAVDDVVIDAPREVSRELAVGLGICAVVAHEVEVSVSASGVQVVSVDDEVAKCGVNGAEIRRRVEQDRAALQERAARKKRSEADYARHKEFVEER